MNIFGQPKKAGGARRDTPSGTPSGRVIAQRVTAVPVTVRDSEPIGTGVMRALAFSSMTSSPMANGNGGGVTLNTGAGIVGRDPRRTGALQNWLALHAPVADPRSSNLGAQAGPSSQPAFPSTGSTVGPTLATTLAQMSLPSQLPSY